MNFFKKEIHLFMYLHFVQLSIFTCLYVCVYAWYLTKPEEGARCGHWELNLGPSSALDCLAISPALAPIPGFSSPSKNWFYYVVVVGLELKEILLSLST